MHLVESPPGLGVSSCSTRTIELTSTVFDANIDDWRVTTARLKFRLKLPKHRARILPYLKAEALYYYAPYLSGDKTLVVTATVKKVPYACSYSRW